MTNGSQEVFFAAVGDVHGHMNKMVQTLINWEQANKKLDFVLQVRDFEPHRNETDLSTIDQENYSEFETLRHALGYDDVGNEYARLITEILEPDLVICGHMHKKYRKQIKLEMNKQVDICCLANVEQGLNSVAIFRFLENSITEL